MKLAKRIEKKIALFLAVSLALIPGSAFAVSEDPPPPTGHITKTCLTDPDEIKPGSIVTYQVVMEVKGVKDECIDNTVFADTWDDRLELVGTPEPCSGYELRNAVVTSNSMTFDIYEYDEDYGGFVIGMLTGGKVTVTYQMKVSEDAAGTLQNVAEFRGNVNKLEVLERDSEEIEVIIENVQEPEEPAVETEEPEIDDVPKTGDISLLKWIMMMFTSVVVAAGIIVKTKRKREDG